MRTNRVWTLDRECLSRALDRWYSRDNPDQETKDRVHDWLMDVLSEGVAMGHEDPPGSGVWYDRIPGTNVGVTFVPNGEDRSICVAIIIDLGTGSHA